MNACRFFVVCSRFWWTDGRTDLNKRGTSQQTYLLKNTHVGCKILTGYNVNFWKISCVTLFKVWLELSSKDRLYLEWSMLELIPWSGEFQKLRVSAKSIWIREAGIKKKLKCKLFPNWPWPPHPRNITFFQNHFCQFFSTKNTFFSS